MKKITKILAVSLLSVALIACDDIVAKPNQVVDGDQLMEINETYYDNNYKAIYEAMVSSGSSNTTILNALIKLIGRKEVSKVYGLGDGDYDKIFTNALYELHNEVFPADQQKTKETYTVVEESTKLEEAIVKDVKKTMMQKVSSDSYKDDYYFQEEELYNELSTSLYIIDNSNGYASEDLLIIPGMDFEDVFKCDYSDYIEKSLFPTIEKKLLTSAYLYSREYSSLGRAYARTVEYIQLDAITDHPDAVTTLINNYIKGAKDGSIPGGSFNLDSLANIYKGVGGTAEEEAWATANNVTTRYSTIEEDLRKVVEFDAAGNPTDTLLAETDRNRDSSLVSTYTGSYSYLPSWGKELKERNLKQLDLVTDNDGSIVIKSGGVTSLPTELRSRLFSSSVASYLTSFEGYDSTSGLPYTLKFLTPKTTYNGATTDDSDLTKYAYYDSSSSSYYLVIVKDYSYNTAYFNSDTADKYVGFDIARILGATSTNQKDALNYYLDAYDIDFGDQDFYDYIESNYPDILDDNYDYKDEIKNN